MIKLRRTINCSKGPVLHHRYLLTVIQITKEVNRGALLCPYDALVDCPTSAKVLLLCDITNGYFP